MVVGVAVKLAVNRGDAGPATWVGFWQASPCGRSFAMADTHSHDAQVHQHDHIHVTQYLGHGQQWEHMDTSHDTSTTTPPSAMTPAG